MYCTDPFLVHRREIENYVWWFSPTLLLFYFFEADSIFVFKMSGRLHRVVFILILRSPLSEPDLTVFSNIMSNYMSGRFTGRSSFFYSRSPSLNRITFCGGFFWSFLFNVGEISEEHFLSTLVLPPVILQRAILRPFGRAHNIHRARGWWLWPHPYIIYI